MTKRLIRHAGQEPSYQVSPALRCRKILEDLTPARAHKVAVELEYWAAQRECDERQADLKVRHDH